MPGTCVIGLQWGDEAKGKLVDILTEDNEIVVRYAGGSNAGHTVVSGGQTWKLSLIPSGILRDGVACVVTGGVVLDPASVIGEIDGLESRGVTVAGKLRISDRAHVVFPWHVAEDRLLNASVAGGEAIGTTGRGIGPCYRDKVGRALAIRLGDLYRDDFRAKVDHICGLKNRMLAAWRAPDGGPETLDAADIHARYAAHAERLRPFVTDTTAFLLDAVEEGKRMLFEGAQGAMLDIDHGTFPYVTSSNSSGLGVSSGSGVPGRWIDRVIGVVKAYSTRVGGGPLPTEQDNAIGQRLRDRGNEYGTVTRRPRRCGWFDAVATRYTARLSGVDELAVMLLDVLGGFDELRICTAYEIDGRRVTQFPSHVDDLKRAVPIYETLPGWPEELTAVRDQGGLPPNARRYLDRIGELLDRPVSIVSVGPDRDQTIFIDRHGSASCRKPKSRAGHDVTAQAGAAGRDAGLPRHVAIIMDGNGRWAQQRGLPRIEGHRRGVTSVRRITEHCARRGIEQLTLYCLSSENWRRPEGELQFLMHLLEQYMIEERGLLMRERIRLAMIGRREGLPDTTLAEIDRTVAMCAANDGMRLCLAINYGARGEIVAAARRLAEDARAGRLDPAAIDEETFAASLDTAGMPDPDLLVRTAGEMRVSNFLLWQISYAELWVTDVAWPDFAEADLDEAITAFARRDRRFGGLSCS